MARRRLRPRGLTRGELIGAVSALLLLAVMFGLAWYGVDRIPGLPGSRRPAAISENGWEGLTGTRWLILLTVGAALLSAAMHGYQPARRPVAAVRLAVVGLAGATATMLVLRVLIDLPSSGRVVDQKVGAVLGLAAALGVLYGASEAVREQRAQMVAAGGRPRQGAPAPAAAETPAPGP